MNPPGASGVVEREAQTSRSLLDCLSPNDDDEDDDLLTNKHKEFPKVRKKQKTIERRERKAVSQE